ncbi:MAG: nucleotidyltransferase family protein [Candidatus Woesearchaeota archaeon]
MKKNNSQKLKELKGITKIVIPLLKKNGVRKAGIFGSYVRGEQNKESDVDLLVQLPKGSSLLDLVGLERELEIMLRKKVDLLTYNGINHRLKGIILKEEVRII